MTPEERQIRGETLTGARILVAAHLVSDARVRHLSSDVPDGSTPYSVATVCGRRARWVRYRTFLPLCKRCESGLRKGVGP